MTDEFDNHVDEAREEKYFEVIKNGKWHELLIDALAEHGESLSTHLYARKDRELGTAVRHLLIDYVGDVYKQELEDKAREAMDDACIE